MRARPGPVRGRLTGPPGAPSGRWAKLAGVYVGVLSVELRVPASRSLKAKRAVVRPIVEGARRRFQVAAAEVGHQDTWQRARLGFAAVAGTAGQAASVLDATERFVWSHPEVEVLAAERHWVDVDP